MTADLTALRDAIDASPDQSATDEARSFLSVAQDRWSQLRQARATAAKTAAAQKAANAVYETYNSVADAALTTLYKTVEDDFSNYYRQINADDEASFKAGLEASAGKLDLEVDFYGIGMFPPMAYHSEGHQDGMGVCLYLRPGRSVAQVGLPLRSAGRRGYLGRRQPPAPVLQAAQRRVPGRAVHHHHPR